VAGACGRVLASYLSLTLGAPVGIHRILFPHGRKAALVRLADRLTQAGPACLALTLSGVSLLIWDVVEGSGPALAVGALALRSTRPQASPSGRAAVALL
jgi:Family of unknown function (DUF6328)